MKRLVLALCLMASGAHAQYIDGLPPITALNTTDILPICQGGSVIPGTCTTRKVTVLQLQGIATGFYVRLTGDTMTGALSGTSLTMSGAGSFGGALTAQTTAVIGTSGAAPITIGTGSIAVASGQNLAISMGGATNTVTFAAGVGLGNAFTITSGSGGNTLDGANPNLVTIGNSIHSRRWRYSGGSVSFTGLADFPRVLEFSDNWTGSYTGTTGSSFKYRFIAATDTASIADDTGGTGLFQVAHNFGGGSASGSRRSAQIRQNLTDSMSSSDSDFFEILQVSGTYSANVGGVNLGTGSRGRVHGAPAQLILASGATFFAAANAAGEVNFAAETGSSYRDFFFRTFVLKGSHRVAGDRENSGLVFAGQAAAFDSSGQGATPTLTKGIVFGVGGGHWPMAASSEIFTTQLQEGNAGAGFTAKFPPQLSTAGLNLSYVDFATQSGHFLKGPGFSVASPSLRLSNLLVSATATGIDVDVPLQYRVTAVGVVTPGTGSAGIGNYHTGDRVYGEVTAGVKAQYLVDSTKVLNVTFVGAVTGADGARTLRGTTGTGTKWEGTATLTGNVWGALTVTVAGNYTVNPAPPPLTVETYEVIAGSAVTGTLTCTVGVGVLTASPIIGDVSSASSGNITPTGGSGTGLVLSTTREVRRMLRLATTRYETAIGGPLLTYQPTPTAKTNHVTLTAAEILTRRIQGTPTANANYTLPTAASLAAAIPGIQVDDMWVFSVENLDPTFQITILANTGMTISTDPVIYQQSGGLGPSARSFGLRYTGTNAFTLYGL